MANDKKYDSLDTLVWVVKQHILIKCAAKCCDLLDYDAACAGFRRDMLSVFRVGV